ncbi:MAG: hypothetical protein LBH28_08515 [Oscillospiraceae bacterium]|jgi:hypothetical protein|nr:hypothetical protein [Oscillospiraceae bacterium]
MEYFLVKPHPDYTDAPLLRDFNDQLNGNDFYLDRSYNMPMRTTIQIMPNEHMDFTDYLYQTVPLFSDNAMKVIRCFDDDFIQKEIILFDTEHSLSQLYFLPFFPRFPSAVLSAPQLPHVMGRPDAVHELNIPYSLPVFFVFKEHKCFLFMRLDLTESLLREGARGLMLQKTIIRDGG